MMLLKSLLLFAMATMSQSTSLRGSVDDALHERRLTSTYYSTSDASVLGASNPDAAIGNPLKGLATAPWWTGNPPSSIPASLEHYYIGLYQIMTGPNQFDWSVLDGTLADAASRNNHAIWRVFIHYPGWGTYSLQLPQYLIDAGTQLVTLSDGDISPQYDDPILLNALNQFIAALGKRYDGHKSLGFIQLGLLGKWGEWHTYPDSGLISQSTMDAVVNWYAAAFKTTKLQCRGPGAAVKAAGMGLHDDSFAYSTLDGAANGNVFVSWFFYPGVQNAGYPDFWKNGVMGGETRPELQGIIFSADYPAGTQGNQDFMLCVNTTHATYMLTFAAFAGSGYTGTTLVNALSAHARMGYNFQVTSVGVSSPSAGSVSVDVKVVQTGVAPFYYPLNLILSCPTTTLTLTGVESLVQTGDSKVFSFNGIPASSSCLNAINITLASDYVRAGRPVKFAQGLNGTVSLNLPLPPATVPAPAPVTIPAPAPVTVPAPAPVTLATTTLTLINANTGTDIGPLSNGMTIDLSSLANLSVRANPVPSFSTGSVQFKYDGAVYNTESIAPYAFNGDDTYGHYYSWTPSVGVHTIVATPFSATAAQGTMGVPVTVAFTVINPAPVTVPASAPVTVPASAPVNVPTSAPVKVSAPAQVTVPAPAQVTVPAPAPVTVPASAPVTVPASAPVKVPASAPVKVPASAPVKVPTPAPVAVQLLSPPFFARATTKPNGVTFTIAGSTTVHSSSTAIAGTAVYAGQLFQASRVSSSPFTYTIVGFVPGSSNKVTLGFAETVTSNCQRNKRVFTVMADSVPLASNLDIYLLAGCNKAYTTTYTVKTGTSGSMALTFKPVISNAMISFIDIVPL